MLLVGALAAGFSGWGDTSTSYMHWALPLLVAGVTCGLLVPVVGHLVALRFERSEAARGFTRALGLTIVMFGYLLFRYFD